MREALYSLDEKELLVLLQSGDRKAFEEIYHRHKSKTYANLLKLVRSDEQAEELLQEVFFKLWKKRELLVNIQSFPAYLNRVTANMVADFFRKAALDKTLQDQLIYSMTELHNPIEDHMDYKESHALIQQAIAALPPQRQTVFKLCKVDGKSYEEVSSLLGISTSTINDHIVKATRSIRKQFAGSPEIWALLIMASWLK